MDKVIYALLFTGLLITGCEVRVDPPAKIEGAAQAKPPDEKKRLIVKVGELRPKFMDSQLFELGGQCNMETLNGSAWTSIANISSPSLPLSITGWGVDAQSKKNPSQTYLRMQDERGKEYYGEALRVDRQDVADYFKDGFYLKSGYQIDADVQALPDATYDVMIVMNVDGKSVLCSSGRKLIIKSKSVS